MGNLDIENKLDNLFSSKGNLDAPVELKSRINKALLKRNKILIFRKSLSVLAASIILVLALFYFNQETVSTDDIADLEVYLNELFSVLEPVESTLDSLLDNTSLGEGGEILVNIAEPNNYENGIGLFGL